MSDQDAPRRFRITPSTEHDGDGAYGVVVFSPEDDGEWVTWEDHEKAVAHERERCAKLVDQLRDKLADNDADNSWWFAEKAEECAAAIRAIK